MRKKESPCKILQGPPFVVWRLLLFERCPLLWDLVFAKARCQLGPTNAKYVDRTDVIDNVDLSVDRQEIDGSVEDNHVRDDVFVCLVIGDGFDESR